MIKKVIYYLKAYWRSICVVCAGLLIWLLFRRKPPKPNFNAEMAALKARDAIKTIEIKHGKAIALEAVQADYQTALATLNREQKIQAEVLRNDPAKLAEFLVRLSYTD